MPAGGFCNSCKFWGSPFDDSYGERFGMCTCPVATASILVDKDDDSYDAEERAMWTKEDFGCVHHEAMMGRNRVTGF